MRRWGGESAENTGRGQRRPGNAALWTELETQTVVDRRQRIAIEKGVLGWDGERQAEEEKPGGLNGRGAEDATLYFFARKG
jgi:hypothetical protein